MLPANFAADVPFGWRHISFVTKKLLKLARGQLVVNFHFLVYKVNVVLKKNRFSAPALSIFNAPSFFYIFV